MKKVKATGSSLTLNRPIKELHRVANPGEIFEVTDERYKYLSGNNPDHVIYVTILEEDKKKPSKIKKEELVEND